MTQTEWLQSAIGYINSDNKNMAIKCINESLRTPPPAAMKFPERKEYPSMLEPHGAYYKAEGWNACLDKCKELNAVNVEPIINSLVDPIVEDSLIKKGEECIVCKGVGAWHGHLCDCSQEDKPCNGCTHCNGTGIEPMHPSEKKECRTHGFMSECSHYEENGITYLQCCVCNKFIEFSGRSKKEGKDG